MKFDISSIYLITLLILVTNVNAQVPMPMYPMMAAFPAMYIRQPVPVPQPIIVRQSVPVAVPYPVPIAVKEQTPSTEATTTTTTTMTPSTSTTQRAIAVGIPVPVGVPVQYAMPALSLPTFCVGKSRPKGCPPCPPCICFPTCTPAFFSFCSPCHQKCRCRDPNDAPIPLPPTPPKLLPGPAYGMPVPVPPMMSSVVLFPFAPPRPPVFF